MPLSEAARTLRSTPGPAAVTGGGRIPEIFISYRREDAPAHAGRLYDSLVDEFGPDQVFMDVDTLEPGVDFVERIHSAVGSADALLVVIGRGWLNAKNLDGERRLEDPEDFVRLEIGLALRGDPVVIPVLVGGATMPAEEELPTDLALLARRNALALSDADWRSGLGKLVAALRRIVEPVAEPETVLGPPARLQEAPPAPPPSRIPTLATILGAVGAVALVAGTWLQIDLWAHPSPRRGDTDGLGYFTSVAPLTVAVGAVGFLLLSYRRGAARLATGLFLGFALAGVARYLSLLGAFSVTDEEETSGVVAGVWIALIGCILIVAAAAVQIAARREETDPGPYWVARALVLGGAALVAVAAFVPFNDHPEVRIQALVDRADGWNALEALGPAALAVAVSIFLGRRRAVASGVLIALGIFLSTLWAARYIGFPAWQPEADASLGLGGFIGLAGGLAILAGGLLARPRSRARGVARAPKPGPEPT